MELLVGTHVADDVGDSSGHQLQSENTRIHIVGTGSIGKLVAHALRGIPNPPPITLIFHRAEWLRNWERSKQEITVQDGDVKTVRRGFDVELMPASRRRFGVELTAAEMDVYDHPDMKPHLAAQAMREKMKTTNTSAAEKSSETRNQSEDPSFEPEFHGHSNVPIKHLILSTKAGLAVQALLPLRHRISRSTVICFLQNGMGAIDEVNETVFPDESSRPTYIQGVVSHGANVPFDIAQRDSFFVVHAGHGSIHLGIVPANGRYGQRIPEGDDDYNAVEAEGHLDRDSEGEQRAVTELSHHNKFRPPGDDHSVSAPGNEGNLSRDVAADRLIRQLLRSPVLSCVRQPSLELLQQQLEKLAINSVLNPLTALIDARNGQLTHNFALQRTMRLLLAETAAVIKALPELQGVANVDVRFAPSRLETRVLKVAADTGENISSMLADVRRGRKTEIEYINGYIVRRGEEVGIKCVVNYAIMQTVIGKGAIVHREQQDVVPMQADI